MLYQESATPSQAWAVLSGMPSWWQPLRLCSRCLALAHRWVHKRLGPWAGGRNLHVSARSWSSLSQVYLEAGMAINFYTPGAATKAHGLGCQCHVPAGKSCPDISPKGLPSVTCLGFLQPSWPQWYYVLGSVSLNGSTCNFMIILTGVKDDGRKITHVQPDSGEVGWPQWQRCGLWSEWGSPECTPTQCPLSES